MLKKLLLSENFLVHYDKDLPIGIARKASNMLISAILFPGGNRAPDRQCLQRHVWMTSKNTAKSRRSTGHHLRVEEVLPVYRRLTLHPRDRSLSLLAMFGPGKKTPSANSLARWAVVLSQFDYAIKYRKTGHHGNMDALSRLPAMNDRQFDGEQSVDDIEMVCAIQDVSDRVHPGNQSSLPQQTARDPVLQQSCASLEKDTTVLYCI